MNDQRQQHPGPLNIQPVEGLPDDERTKERELAAIVQNPDADQRYNAIPLTFGGLVVNIDLYRELLPEYQLDAQGAATPAVRQSRTKYTAATYASAKAASMDRFQREVRHARRVILLGGGPASGKTSVLRRLIRQIDPSDTIVYDTSLTDRMTAEAEISHAIKLGAFVEVAWVYAPFGMAVTGMIQRAVNEGRYLTLRRMVELHTGSRQTIQHIVKQMSGLPRLTIGVSGAGAGGGDEIPLADLARVLNDPNEDVTHACAQRQYDSCDKGLRIPEDLRQRILSGKLH